MNKEQAMAAARSYNAHLAPKLNSALSSMTVAQLKAECKLTGRRLPSGPKVRADYVENIQQALTAACYDLSGYTRMSGYVQGQFPKSPVLRSVLGV